MALHSCSDLVTVVIADERVLGAWRVRRRRDRNIWSRGIDCNYYNNCYGCRARSWRFVIRKLDLSCIESGGKMNTRTEARQRCSPLFVLYSSTVGGGRLSTRFRVSLH